MCLKLPRAIRLLFLSALLLLAGGCSENEAVQAEIATGTLVDGYRVVEVPPGRGDLVLTVYRGDYVKFRPAGFPGGVVLTIPTMDVESELPAAIDGAPYFKMKETGVYPFAMGDSRGEIQVIEFSRPQYTEVASEEAVKLIRNLQPLILDVRTPPEYAQGHLQKAVLIPLQDLQRRIGDVTAKKTDPVFIYCATGNRSTVAAKILIDGGFRRIYNLRRGIAEWAGSGLPVIR